MQLPLKLGITGVVFTVLEIILGFLAFDSILKFGIRDQTSLRKRNEVRGIYLKIPFPLNFRVYFFNISNPMEVQKGEVPDLKEIGPYCYDEYKEKIDVTDNDADDSLTYSPYDIFEFNQEKSGNLTDEDYITVLNPLIVGMVNQVTKDSPALLSIVNQAIIQLFQNPKSIYLTAKVKDILFDGIEINCKVSQFAAKAVCTQLKSLGLKANPDKNLFFFSLLGMRNATVGKPMKVGRGISKSRDLGKVIEFDGKKEMTIWADKRCNRFRGTDGWIIPPLLTPEEGIWAYSSDLCRNVGAVYVNDTVMKGINVRQYEANLGDMQLNENDKCYCATPKTCLRKGVFDLSKCMGVPIYATLPHFLDTDSIYLRQVKGLNPVTDNHIIRIIIEPMTSAPIDVKLRMQLNLQISSNDKIGIMKTVPEALHPIFWLEEGVELEGPLLKKIKTIFLALEIIRILRWFGIFGGLGITAFGVYLHNKNKKSLKVTSINNSTTQANKSELDSTKIQNELVVQKGDKKEDKNINRASLKMVKRGYEFEKYFD